MGLATFLKRGRAASESATDAATAIPEGTDVIGFMDNINDDPDLTDVAGASEGSTTSRPSLKTMTDHSVSELSAPSLTTANTVAVAAGQEARAAAARAAAIDEALGTHELTSASDTRRRQGSVCPDRHVAAYSKTINQVDQLNLLAGIAWLGEASARHIGRLWIPGRHMQNVRRRLNILEAEGLITWRWWYYKQKEQALPVRYGKLWSLTEACMQLVRDLPTFPKRYHGPRTDVLLAHDTLTTQVLVHMIEQARIAGLSGVYIEREAQLNPPERRPIMDAVITLRTGGTPFPTNAVPWFNPPYDCKETNESSRRYAIENDRDSEQIAVIIGKAYAYQQAATHEWVERNGQFPIPVWIVPTERRRDNIMHAWVKAWPDGKWLMTTDTDLIDDRWIEYFDGRMRERRLFA